MMHPQRDSSHYQVNTLDSEEEDWTNISRMCLFVRDKKRYAWAALSILKNNQVSSTLYYFLLIIEYLQLIFIYVVFALIYYKTIAIDYDEGIIWVAANTVQSTLQYTSSQAQFQMIVIIVALGMNLVIILLVVALAYHFDSPEKAKNSNLTSKIVSVTIQIRSKLIYTIEVILLAQVFKNTSFSSQIAQILLYAGSILALVLSTILELTLTYSLTIRVRLISDVPWCSQKSMIPLLKIGLKLAQAVCLVIQIPQATAIVLFIIAIVILGSYLYLQPYHSRQIYFIDITFLSILASQYLHIMVVSFDSGGSQGRLADIVTFLLFFIALFSPFFAHSVGIMRKEFLQCNLLMNMSTLKTEQEIERSIIFFTECLEKIGGHSTSVNLNYQLGGSQYGVHEQNTALEKHICGLILYHRETCHESAACFCRDFEDSLHAIRLLEEDNRQRSESRNLRHSSIKKRIQSNHQEEEEKDGATLHDVTPFEELDVSSDSQLLQKQRLRRGHHLPKGQDLNVERNARTIDMDNDMQQEQKQFLKGMMTSLFQAEFLRTQLNNQKNPEMDQDLPEGVKQIILKHDNNTEILDISSMKIQTVVNILYLIVCQHCEANLKSHSLMFFKAYFELFVLRKKYLAHQTLTKLQGEDQLSILSYMQFQVDQQYLIEKASILYLTKEDQLMDVDRIIIQNHHYKHFYSLNEETAQQLKLFWAHLANTKNIDIEKLFDTGVKTSELIQQTKDKFQDLVSEGIDKRNSNLYYMYAKFNLYVLNSEDISNEYMSKMIQIQRMNRTLLDTSYKDHLITDVDKSGFLLVRGSFSEFGQIINANRKLCKMLGYNHDQLNGASKIINVLMPQLISEKHHEFLDKFRKTGIPVFIQRQQHLYIKDSQGYINPFKVYIKFHYDKMHGHVFCGIVNRVRNFNPFKNKKRYDCDQLLTIMTDEAGTIYEISPSVTQFFGISLKFVQQNINFLTENVKIWQLLNGGDQDMQSFEQSSTKEIFTTVNPEFFSDSESGKPIFAAQYALQVLANQAKVQAQELYSKIDADPDFDEKFVFKMIDKQYTTENMQVELKVKMAEVRHKDLLTVRYFFIEVLQSTTHGNTLSKLLDSNKLNPYNRISKIDDGSMFNQKYEKLIQEQDELLNYNIFEGNSSSSQNNNSNSSNSNVKFAELVEKDIDQLIRSDTRTPKILNKLLWLVLFAFMVTSLISAIILGLFISDSNQTNGNMVNLTSSLQRTLYSTQVMNLLRGLINNNVGIENNTSQSQMWKGLQSLGYNVTGLLSSLIDEKLNDLKRTQQQLNMGNKNPLNVTFLNSLGVMALQQQDPNVAVNMLISDILSIVSNVALLGNINFTNTFGDYYQYYNQLIKKPNLKANYNLIQMEQQIFFVFENYVNVFESFNNQTSYDFLYQDTTSLRSNDSQRFLILMVFSIVTLFITLLLVSPVTMKIRRQKYQVLMFFLRLGEEVTRQSVTKSTQFDNMFSMDSKLNNEDQLDIEDSESDFMYEEEESYQARQSVEFEEDPHRSAPVKLPLSNNSLVTYKNRAYLLKDMKKIVKRTQTSTFSPMSIKFNAEQKKLNHQPIFQLDQKSQITKNNNDTTQSKQETDQDGSNTQKYIPIAGFLETNQKLQKRIDKGFKEIVNPSDIKLNEIIKDQSPIVKKELSDDTKDEERKQEKEQREQVQEKIKSISSKSQSSIFYSIIILFLLLSSYFVGIYIFTTNSIDSFQSSFKDLSTVYERSNCMSKLFFYTREDIQSGQVAPVGGEEGFISNSMNQLWRCMTLEQDFTQLKRQKRAYISLALDLIQQTEGSGLCTIVSQNSLLNITTTICSSIQNNLFDNGLSLAHQSFMKSILLTLLNYYSVLPTLKQNATSALILQNLRSPSFLDQLYSNEFLLGQVNTLISDSVNISIQLYIEKLRNMHIGIFLGLLGFLVVIGIYFFCRLFTTMRQEMFSSHTMIAMLPKHMLQKKDQVKIREFLMS